jgi:hypothetical protein
MAAYVLPECSAQMLSGAVFRRSYELSVGYIAAQAASLVPVLIYVAIIWGRLRDLQKCDLDLVDISRRIVSFVRHLACPL